MTTANGRQSEYRIDPMFLDRWSPRAFTGEIMPREDLLTMLDAAHWAPSASNYQPWHFLYALKGGPDFDTFVSLLVPGNQVWAKDTSALLFALSDTQSRKPDGTISRPFRSHSFDTGAAWAMLALQARKLGYYAHGMGGVEFDQVSKVLAVPGDFKVEAAIAVGKLVDLSTLDEERRAREVPNSRKPLASVISEGRFSRPGFE